MLYKRTWLNETSKMLAQKSQSLLCFCGESACAKLIHCTHNAASYIQTDCGMKFNPYELEKYTKLRGVFIEDKENFERAVTYADCLIHDWNKLVASPNKSKTKSVTHGDKGTLKIEKNRQLSF